LIYNPKNITFFNQFFYEQDLTFFGIRLLGCGHYDSKWFKQIDRKRTLESYAIVLLLNGTGTFESQNKNNTKIESGNVLFLFPDEWHQYTSDKNSEWEELWITFSGSTVDHLLKSGNIDKSRPIYKLSDISSIYNIFTNILNIAYLKNQNQLMAIPSKIYELMCILETPRYSSSKIIEESISKIVVRMQNAPEIKYNFKIMAEDMGISYESLRKSITMYTGLPPQALLNSIRISSSIQYLLEGRPIGEVSSLVGINDQFYFSRMFKKIIGMSPRKYKLFYCR
jgi:AraC-like DNA-binding protein